MFEFEVQSPTDVRLRVGRLHLRTWPPPIMLLPKRYRSPVPIYAVEFYDEEDAHCYIQLAAFFSEEEALICKAQLEAEGRIDLVINVIVVHTRVRDWHFDR